MRFLLYLSTALLLFTAGCKKSEDSAPDRFFGKTWYNTFQPGDDGRTIFSTTNPNLGWRYDGFRLEADGSFLEYGLGPADGAEERAGTWKSEDSQNFRITFRDPTREGYLLRIAKPTSNWLQARRDY